jgi:hypothetical protein
VNYAQIMVTVIGRIGEIPPDHKGYDMPSDQVVVEADSYDEGFAAVKQAVPEGWRLLFVRTLQEGETLRP